MRRTALIIVLALVLVPTAAWAAKEAATDGTLSVRNADGMVRLDLDRGVVIGRIGAGRPNTLILYGPQDPTCTTALVWDDGVKIDGAEKLLGLDRTKVEACVYRGDDLRFRLVGADAETIRLQGDDMSLSGVGRGRGLIRGKLDHKLTPQDESLADGTWSLNGEDYESLPDEAESFVLAAPITPTTE